VKFEPLGDIFVIGYTDNVPCVMMAADKHLRGYY